MSEDLGPLFKELERNDEPRKVFEKLTALNMIPKFTKFPKLVVVGDPKAGKLKMLGELIKLGLPDDYDVQLPLIVKFLKHAEPSRKFMLRYLSATFEQVSEQELVSRFKEYLTHRCEHVILDEVNAIELTIAQKDVSGSGFTIIVLPGVDDYHDDDAEQKKILDGFVSKHAPLTDTNCLYLHVMSTPTHECSTFLKIFRLPSERTITVFSNVESCSKSTITNLTSKKAKFSFGRYFFVRGESGRSEDIRQVKFDPFSKIDTKLLGYQVIAREIVTRLWSIFFNHHSLVYEKVLEELQKTTQQKEQFEKKIPSSQDALSIMLACATSASFSLQMIFFSKDYREYTSNESMHAAEKMHAKFDDFRSQLLDPSIHIIDKFLENECQMLKNVDAKHRPSDSFIPTYMLPVLMDELLSRGSDITNTFITDVFGYIDSVVTTVLVDHAKSHQKLHSTLKVMAKMVTCEMKINFKEKVNELFKLERSYMHTCQTGYLEKWEDLESVEISNITSTEFKGDTLAIKGLGTVKVKHLKGQKKKLLTDAFDLKMRLVCYWPYVVNRLVDCIFLQLMSFLKNMVGCGIKSAMQTSLKAGVLDINKLLEPEPSASQSSSDLEERTAELMEVKKSIQKLHLDHFL